VRPIHLSDGRVVEALVYLADRKHRQFAGKWPAARAAALVRDGRGVTGANVDYLHNTMSHLRDLGLRDRSLEELERRVDASRGSGRRARRS